MDYKIGNNITAVIRGYRAEGDTSMEAHAPYTILESCDARLSFREKNIKAETVNQWVLDYNENIVNELTLYNIPLTEKILAMCFQEQEDVLCTIHEETTIRNNKLVLKENATDYYNIYVYSDGMLIHCQDYSNTRVINISLEDQNVLVFYEVKKFLGFNLTRPQNQYVTLDVNTLGNVDNTTSKIHMHFEKCAYKTRDALTFNNENNTITLVFKIISTNNDYIIMD